MTQQQQHQEEQDVMKLYCQDLTEKARLGKIDPIIGRDEEVRRAMQILMRRTKNNPVLLAEPGVGKTAMVEKLAQRIVDGDVPSTLQDCAIYSLDMGALVAGTSYRGEFEKRLKAIVEKLKEGKSDGQSILFIDELHLLAGAGKTDGAMDAANLLKPALSRGEIRVIGATTLDEYRKYIEKDSALERRFQKINLTEPTVEETVSILRGLRQRFETHYGLEIDDAALVAAAKLSDRYIQDRFQPDKAIDCIDSAFSTLRVALDSKPEAIDGLERRKLQLEIEEISLKKEKGDASKQRLADVQKELVSVEKQLAPLTAQYEKERGRVVEIADAKRKVEQLQIKAERFKRERKLAQAADLINFALPDLQEHLRKLEREQDAIDDELSDAPNAAPRIVRSRVTTDVIADVVSRWTGVPVTRLLATEAAQLLQLGKTLEKTVVGQPHAVKTVAEAVMRSRAGLGDPNRPTGVFLFAGPSGTGKTLLAKTLAGELFDQTRGSFLRIDMSEFREEHATAKLIGAPPGYVGHEEAGMLTEHLRRKPFSVVLFDEIEKAHPKTCDILLQLFDEGRLTDSHGRLADGRNAVFIVTTNLGAKGQHAAAAISDPKLRRRESRKAVMEAVRGFLRPEMVNRLDEVVVFDPLGDAALTTIVSLEIANINKRLEDKRIKFVADSDALTYIAQTSVSPVYGARPMRRWLERHVTTRIATMVLEGAIKPGSVVRFSVEQGHDHVLSDDGRYEDDEELMETGAQLHFTVEEEQATKRMRTV